MRDVLLDIIRQTNGLMECLKISGTDKVTLIKGCDSEKTLFVEAELKNVVSEFEGEFGISNMSLLNGLLNFANYRTSDAVFSVKKMERNGQNTVEKFEFRNAVTGNDADFRMMDPRHIPEQATIPTNIPWDVEFSPSKSKISEFSQLASLYAEVDKCFGIRTVKGDLQFFIGDEENSSSHRASMVFENGASGELKGNLSWTTAQFLSIMKLSGNNPTTMKVTNRGVLLISVETAHGIYNYFLRANR